MLKAKLITCTSLAFLTVATACVREKPQVYKLNIIIIYADNAAPDSFDELCTLLGYDSKGC